MDAMTAGDQLFFKAVRPDGTDFRTGTVDYAALSGTAQTLPLLSGGPCCGPGVYHASTEAAETLIGGTWPCRLFRVAGVPVSSSNFKRGFRTLGVREELPAHLALGPNGAVVAELIHKAGRPTEAEVRALSAAWSAAGDAAWSAAGSAARSAARNAARSAAWSAAGDAARSAAGSAAEDAAWALVVKDLITPEHFGALYGPWASVMETGSGR